MQKVFYVLHKYIVQIVNKHEKMHANLENMQKNFCILWKIFLAIFNTKRTGGICRLSFYLLREPVY